MISLYHKYFYKLNYCFNKNINFYYNFNKVMSKHIDCKFNINLFNNSNINQFVIDFYNKTLYKTSYTLTPNELAISDKRFKYIPDFKSFCKIIIKNIK